MMVLVVVPSIVRPLMFFLGYLERRDRPPQCVVVDVFYTLKRIICAVSFAALCAQNAGMRLGGCCRKYPADCQFNVG